MADENLNYLSMSDEDWLNAAPPTAEVVEEEVKEEEPVASEEATEVQPTGETEEATDTGEETEEAKADDDSEETTEEVQEESQPATEEKTEKEIQAELDYKAAYEKLTKPFKANGREVQIKDVDDAIQLMQMGANYSKKMAALKPHLKLMKLLESNGLMSEDQISYLIDLKSKNPAAISKLIEESGIDPMDLDTSKASEYKPTARHVDDREIELDQVLEDIKESPAYSRTLDVVAKQWDGASKKVIADSPQLLRVINAHMENGIYDAIHAEIENERMYGRLTGLSDIEAYRQVGDAIQARGGFNHLGRQVNTAPPVKQVAPPPKPSQEQVQKVKERKRAASPTIAAPTQQAQEFNPLALSDEEFAKLTKPNYL